MASPTELIELYVNVRDALGAVLAELPLDNTFTTRTMRDMYHGIDEALKGRGSAAYGSTRMPIGSQEARARIDDDVREWKESRAFWTSLALPEREHLVLETIGAERLTVPEIVQRIADARGDGSDRFFYSDVYPVVARLRGSRDLDRVRETVAGKKMIWRYSRNADLSGPIADLDRMLTNGEGS